MTKNYMFRLFSDYTLHTDNKDDHSEASGVKPVTYNPSLFELADDGGKSSSYFSLYHFHRATKD